MEKLIKELNVKIDGVDADKGIVEAYANIYNVEDSDGDISAPGSFIKTVSENLNKLRVYKNHNTTQLIGVPKELNATDPKGLFTVTKFQMDTDLGKDMFNDIKLITENNQDADLSIGYSVIRRDPKNPKIIQEYKLYEYSFLTSWGANPMATVTGIKSKDLTKEFLIEHFSKMYNLPYSDERLVKLEHILKSLTVAPSNDTQDDEPIFTINSFGKF